MRAVERIDAMSLPASGSVNAKPPMTRPAAASCRRPRHCSAFVRTRTQAARPCAAKIASASGDRYARSSRATQSARTLSQVRSRRKTPTCARRSTTRRGSSPATASSRRLTARSSPRRTCAGSKNVGRALQVTGIGGVGTIYARGSARVTFGVRILDHGRARPSPAEISAAARSGPAESGRRPTPGCDCRR
jgi:hypothetical protein